VTTGDSSGLRPRAENDAKANIGSGVADTRDLCPPGDFPAAADKDAYLQRDWSNAPVQVTWNIDGVDKGKLYRSADDEAKLPYIITTFTDDDRVQYLLYVHWQDHTLTDLMDNWWKPATF